MGPLDFNCIDDFLKCFIDFKNILNYWIPWDIDYTQSYTTTITKIKTPRVNNHQMWIYCLNNYFKHWITYYTCKTNWNNSSQLCCSGTTACYLAAPSAQEGVQPHWVHMLGWYKWSWRRKMITRVISIVNWLGRRLMSLLENHWTGSLPYWPYCKCLNEAWKPFNAWLRIVDNGKALHLSGNKSCSWHQVSFWTPSHPEQHRVISWLLRLTSPCGPSATNHLNCQLVTLTRLYPNRYYNLQNVPCIDVMNDILIVINVICEVSQSLQTPSNVIFEVPIGHCTHLAKSLRVLMSDHRLSLFTWLALSLQALHRCTSAWQDLNWDRDSGTPPFRLSWAKSGMRPYHDTIAGMIV